MLNRVLTLAIASLSGLLLAGGALADEALVRENRPIVNVSAVSLKCSGDVVITQGSKEELIVEADKSVISPTDQSIP